jgi:hypothetical protein
MPTYVHEETAQQRHDRLGTAEDPGINPDPNKHFWRYGRSYHISRWTRLETVLDPDDPTLARHGYVNFKFEIYQVNPKYVWVWVLDPDVTPAVPETPAVEAPPPNQSRWGADHIAFFKRIRPEFVSLTPVSSAKTIRFEESSDGLPTYGSWRNSLAVADMNGDGFVDLIAPPERKGNGVPQIFLGDGKGHWHLWTEATYPHGVDYGGVVAADFNKDGHMDLAFAVHLTGIFVFLGDGKGHFTESTEGLPRDFATRRIIVADVDGDGYPDIVASSEGPTAIGNQPDVARIRAFLNREKGMAWEAVNVSDVDSKIGGDWLSVGNFNGDRVPDFITSSVYFGSWEVVQLSQGANRWKAVNTDGDLIPSMSYYLASTTGKFVKGSKTDDAIVSYTRFWPNDLDTRILSQPEIMELTEVDRFVFAKDGSMKRIPIARWNGHIGVRGLAAGDFDGDGNLDFVVTREEPDHREVMILLGDGKGGFTRANVQGLTLEDNDLYDIKIADVNGDGHPDVILMYEAMENRRDDFMRMAISGRPGSIKVFLNRGASKVAPAIKAAK